MFSIGDYIVHPMHGAGIIDDIVQEKIAGTTKEYYVFKMPLDGLVLKIPVSSADKIGVRTILSQEETDALLRAIPGLETEDNVNWSKRYQENLQRLKSGDLYEVARVIKSLTHRDATHGLSTGERKMLHNAKQMIISEIVLVEQSEYQDVQSRLDCAVTQNISTQ